MAVHGDIRELTFNHPTIGNGIFHPKAGEGNTFDPGGIRSNDDAAQITTTGEIIDQLSFVRGSMEIVVENDTDIRLDWENARKLAADPTPATWTVTMMNGSVYVGVGKPVGDIQADLQAGTMTLKLAAPEWNKV